MVKAGWTKSNQMERHGLIHGKLDALVPLRWVFVTEGLIMHVSKVVTAHAEGQDFAVVAATDWVAIALIEIGKVETLQKLAVLGVDMILAVGDVHADDYGDVLYLTLFLLHLHLDIDVLIVKDLVVRVLLVERLFGDLFENRPVVPISLFSLQSHRSKEVALVRDTLSQINATFVQVGSDPDDGGQLLILSVLR